MSIERDSERNSGEKTVHPLRDKDWYTPVTPEMIAMLERQKQRYGTWRALAAAIPVRTRVLRFIRNGRNKAVSMSLWERVLIATGLEHTLEDYIWFTPEDLVKLGIWRQTHILGVEPYRSGESRRLRRSRRAKAAGQGAAWE